jgi:hypothetical protein
MNGKHSTSMQALQQQNKAIGRYFFSKDTMRFFASRIASDLLDYGYFITSEKRGFDDKKRQYKIRQAYFDIDARGLLSFTGEINNSPVKEVFLTLAAAERYVAKLIQTENEKA